ncbi:MAG: SAM-dependent DNA methyltransferase, partial [Gallionella sp.]
MAKRSTTELAFSAIRIEGGLLAADFLGCVARFEATGQTEADYDIPKGLKLRDEIGRYWKIALNLWQDFQAGRQRTDHDAHSFTGKDFLEPFCRHVLGFTDIQAIGQVTLAERIFPIGYQAVAGQVPLVFA